MLKNLKSGNSLTHDGRETDRHWYAVYTVCRHEKSVARHLEQREIESFLPVYRAQHRWKDGSKMILDLPLFSGYIFVRIHRKDRVKVLDVPGVLFLLGATNSQPTPLPDFEIETLRSGLDPLRAEPYPILTVGDRVRIRVGALAGMEGILVRKKNNFRIVLTLDLLMQSIAVEVNGEDLETVEPSWRLTLETPPPATDRLQQISAYDIECLDSCPDSPQSGVFPSRSAGRIEGTF